MVTRAGEEEDVQVMRQHPAEAKDASFAVGGSGMSCRLRLVNLFTFPKLGPT
jgi:hypothetical protein